MPSQGMELAGKEYRKKGKYRLQGSLLNITLTVCVYFNHAAFKWLFWRKCVEVGHINGAADFKPLVTKIAFRDLEQNRVIAKWEF